MVEIIPLSVGSGAMKNYSYLIFDKVSRDAVVIDPAWKMDVYIEAIEKNRLRLKGILVTHTHFDHINLVRPMSERYSADIWVGEEEADMILSGSPKANLHYVEHMGVIRCGQLECRAFKTPGHSKGGTCYQIEGNLFTGDTLFIEGCGMCFDSSSNVEDLYKSVQFINDNFSSKTRIYPGHRYGELPGQSLEFVRQKNIYLHLDESSFAKYRLRPNQNNLLNFLE